MRYALVAANEALRNAGWLPDNDDKRAVTGVAVGCGLSCTSEVAAAGALVVSRMRQRELAGCMGLAYRGGWSTHHPVPSWFTITILRFYDYDYTEQP